MVPENVQESDWFFPGDQFWGRDPGFLIFMVHSPAHNTANEGGSPNRAFNLSINMADFLFTSSSMVPKDDCQSDWFVLGDHFGGGARDSLYLWFIPQTTIQWTREGGPPVPFIYG